MMRKIWLIGCVACIMLTGCGDDQLVQETTDTETTSFVIESPTTTEQVTEMTEDIEVTTEATTETVVNPREDVLISIDPGHQSERVDMSALEPNAPGSTVMKQKATGGTAGRFTGVPEYQLNLDISLKLRDALKNRGYKVIMTREDNETAISNMERAQLANDAGANVSIRIHANGSDDPSTNGALALIGSADNQYVGHLYEESYRLADAVLGAYCDSTGMANLGITGVNDMTGINWSEIPVMILEMGFMTNESDDRNMQDQSYQEKMVTGIVDGIEKYFGFDDISYTNNETVSDSTRGKEDEELKKQVNELLEQQRNKGAVASAYMKNLKTGEYVDLSTATHRSASIIKLFVAGCTYQNIGIITTGSYTENDIDTLIHKMISSSDNDATNTLVRILGNDDASAGMKKVTDFAYYLGYPDTKMGRLMLDFDSPEENYTTVLDAGSFLEKIYNNEFDGADKILAYMKEQERTSKIPAGIPDGITVANKTGELDDVEHDVAIVYGEDADYILCVMLSQLPDCASGRETIKEISTVVYEHWK